MTDDKPPLPPGTPNISPGEPPTAATKKPPILTNIPPGAVSTDPMSVPPIPLNPAPVVPAQVPSASSGKKEEEPKDTFRELIETVVFVVVLVLMLKTFLAEAFVIPTGSMADTLLGYHYKVICQKCGYPNLVNASSEADPQGSAPEPVIRAKCQNCEFWNQLRVQPQER
jgi:hypothetical protein